MNHIISVIFACVAALFIAQGMSRYLDGISFNKKLLKSILRPSYGAEVLPLLQILVGYLQMVAALYIWFW